MKLQWFGHSFFMVTSENEKKVVFDPFDETVGYPIPDLAANVVCVSHSHSDHNNVRIIGGKPEIIQQAGLYVRDGYRIRGFISYHDRKLGKERGGNLVYRLEMDGMTVIHTGDLGMLPGNDEIEAWKPLDILMVPVGGIYTINGQDAQNLIELLHPKIVIPMHYRTHFIHFELYPVEDFSRHYSNVKAIPGAKVDIVQEDLPKSTEIWVFQIPV